MVAVLVTAACGADDEGGSGGEGDTVVISADPTALPLFIADKENLFEGVDVEVDTTGHDSAAATLLANDVQVAWMGPLEAAEFVSQGDELKYISTAGALNMWNAVVVPAEDADQYRTINDLAGKKLGISGFGTGVWAGFEVFADMFYGVSDAAGEFKTVTADPGALLALLENGEVDASLLHSAESTAARFDDRFETLLSFTELTQEKLGQPLVITGSVAAADWIDDHPDEVAAVRAGLDAGVDWMMANPDEFREGGKYEDLARDAGWYASPEAANGVIDLLTEGKWFLKSDTYTQEWQDAMFAIIEAGEGILVEEVPAKGDVFYNG